MQSNQWKAVGHHYSVGSRDPGLKWMIKKPEKKPPQTPLLVWPEPGLI